MGLGMAVREIWEKVAGVEAARDDGERKTTATPLGMNSIFAPFRTSGVQNVLPKPTAFEGRRSCVWSAADDCAPGDCVGSEAIAKKAADRRGSAAVSLKKIARFLYPISSDQFSR
jgi:hypothetical protein